MSESPAHKYPRWVIPTEHLTKKVDLPSIFWRDPFLGMGEKEPGKVLCWLNGSSVVHKGKRWLAYRIEMKRWFLWSRICLVQLDEKWNPIPGTDKLLPLHTRFDGWGAEDPRLFVFQGKLHMAYGDGSRMLLATFTDKGELIKSKYVPTEEEVGSPFEQQSKEKNWGFFSVKNRLFAQQYAAPNIIIEFDPDNWNVINKWTHEWVWRSPHGAELHGGSSPVFHNGKLWRFCHCYRSLNRGPWINWYGQELKDFTAARYSVFLVELDPNPPFYPLSVSREPILWTDFDHKNAVSPTPHAVVFIGSAERSEDGWTLVYGENDNRIVVQTLPDSDLEDRIPIRFKDPNTGESNGLNVLHFVWIQGQDLLPDKDKENVKKWKDMNPDWEIKIWDRGSLESLIHSYPEFVKAWQDLVNALDKFPKDKSIVAKVSDFARLVLLYHTHAIGQEWNVYADTDTVPMRPLTSFLTDDYLYGQNVDKEVDPNLNPFEKPWDWSNVDFALSQENRMNKRPAAVTNAVMIGRPQAPILYDLIKKGIVKRWQPTLKAWGPDMLEEHTRPTFSPKNGWRSAILPYHYMAYNPSQHKGKHSPMWTLCHHLNEYRWMIPGVKGTLTGGLNGPVKRPQIV